ncbi:hypothetical protein P4S72_25225 [Vibrio sp. PP-XX7]
MKIFDFHIHTDFNNSLAYNNISLNDYVCMTDPLNIVGGLSDSAVTIFSKLDLQEKYNIFHSYVVSDIDIDEFDIIRKLVSSNYKAFKIKYWFLI